MDFEGVVQAAAVSGAEGAAATSDAAAPLPTTESEPSGPAGPPAEPGAPAADGVKAFGLFGYITGGDVDAASAPAATPSEAKPADGTLTSAPAAAPSEAKPADKVELDPNSPDGVKAHIHKAADDFAATVEAFKTEHPDDAAGIKAMESALKQQQTMADAVSAAADVAKSGGSLTDRQHAMLGSLEDKLAKAKEAGNDEDVQQLQGVLKAATKETEAENQANAYHSASPEAREKAKEAAAEIFSAAEGTGTNFEKFDAAIQGKSPEEIALIKGAFNEHYKDQFKGRTIDDYLEGAGTLELTPAHKLQLMAESKGDLALQVQAELMGSVNPLGSNSEGTLKALEDMRKLRESGPEGAAKAQAIQESWAKASGKSFDEFLDHQLGGRTLAVARAVMSEKTGEEGEAAINLAKLDLATHQGLFNTTDKKKVNEIMEGYSGKDKSHNHDIMALRKAAGDSGKTLEKLVVEDADTGSGDQQFLRAVVGDANGNQDKIGMSAGRIQSEMDAAMKKAHEDGRTALSMKMNDGAILEEFGRIKDPEERKAVLERMGGGFEKLLQSRTGLSEEAMAENMDLLVKEGRLKPSTTVALAIKEDDVELLRKATSVTKKGEHGEEVTEQMSKEEMDEVNADYKKQFNHELHDDLNDDFHGMHGKKLHDSTQILKGKPADAMEAINRMLQDYAFERGGNQDRTVDLFSQTGAMLDADIMKVVKLRQRIVENGGKPTEEDERELEDLSGWHKGDTKNFSEAKESVANTEAAVVEGAVALAGTLASGGTLGGIVFAGVGALAGTATKMQVQGSDAGLDVAAAGVGKAITDMVTAGVMETKAVEGMLRELGAKGGALLKDSEGMQKLFEEGIKGGGKSFVESIVSGTLSGKSPLDPKFLGESLLGALKGFASELAGAGIGESLHHALDPDKFPPRVLTNFTKAVSELGIDQAFEKIKGEAEGAEESGAVQALKAVFGLLKGTVQPAEEKDPVKDALGATVATDKQRKANQKSIDDMVNTAH